jgi:hypothetical protein
MPGDTSDAVARETAWLQTSGDGLPALAASVGGPWEIIQAYMPRTPRTQAPGIYVLRGHIGDLRVSSQRIRPGYIFRLKLRWPIRTGGAPLAETEQQAFDVAVNLLLQRIRGPLGDKSHGGRFLSAGETPARPPAVAVDFEDPEQTMALTKDLRAVCIYSLDDTELNG